MRSADAACFHCISQELEALSPEQQNSGLSEVKLPSLSSRFQGITAQFASTSQAACTLAASQGLEVCASLSLQSSQAAVDAQSASQWAGAAAGLPDPAAFCEALISQLQPEEGTSGTDLVMAHVDVQDLLAHTQAHPHAPAESSHPTEASSDAAPDEGKVDPDEVDASFEGMEWLDALVKHLMQSQAVKERVLLSVVLSAQGKPLWSNQQAQAAAGSGTGPSGLPQQQQQAMQPGGARIDPAAFVVTPRSALMAASLMSGGASMKGLDLLDEGGCPQITRPLQSFQFLGLKQVDVALSAPALVARRLPGVIRR